MPPLPQLRRQHGYKVHGLQRTLHLACDHPTGEGGSQGVSEGRFEGADYGATFVGGFVEEELDM